MKHIINALTLTDAENKIQDIENVLACELVGFNTKTPVVRAFFNPDLTQEKKYSILNQIKEIMVEYGLGDNQGTNWCSIGMEVVYQR